MRFAVEGCGFWSRAEGVGLGFRVTYPKVPSLQNRGAGLGSKCYSLKDLRPSYAFGRLDP